jgi:hypothetical protein
VSVLRRALPVVLAVVAAVADSRGAYGLAMDALIAAVPFTAVAALLAFGDYLEDRERPLAGLQAVLWGCGLVLVILSCAVRSPAAQTHQLPTLASSALTACLVVYAVKALMALAPYARLALRPAKP